jgi:hypothetical protein
MISRLLEECHESRKGGKVFADKMTWGVENGLDMKVYDEVLPVIYIPLRVS